MLLPFVAEPAPPRSLYAVNATPSSVTLLWADEGVVDYYQVLCKASSGSKELKVRLFGCAAPPVVSRSITPTLFSVLPSHLFQALEPQTAHSQTVTVTGLMPSSTYNCSITSFSYSSASKPAHISISTAGRGRCGPTPDSVASAPTAFFMCPQQKK